MSGPDILKISDEDITPFDAALKERLLSRMYDIKNTFNDAEQTLRVSNDETLDAIEEFPLNEQEYEEISAKASKIEAKTEELIEGFESLLADSELTTLKVWKLEAELHRVEAHIYVYENFLKCIVRKFKSKKTKTNEINLLEPDFYY